jgi:hypothetical protein
LKRLAVLFAAATLGFGAAALAPATERLALPEIAAAKACSSGYVHAVLPTGHKCLRRGQFCVRSYDRYYHRYGFHCHRYDASVARYRLE